MKQAIRCSSISKKFGSSYALQSVQFSAYEGEVLALVGENGAGKSTLMKILSGVWPYGSYQGEFWVSNSETNLKLAQFKNSKDAHRAGIAMIHQELSLFPELSVAEHLELDQLPNWIQWTKIYERTQTFLDSIGFQINAKSRVKDLSLGQSQLVEIARALYRKSHILIFDEPTSALTEKEAKVLDRVILQLRSVGKTIIYITHRMDEVFRLADRMLVLRDGSSVAEFPLVQGETRIPRSEVEPKMIRAMVGRPIQDIYPSRKSPQSEELLRVENFSVKADSGNFLVKDLGFSLKRGEVLGLGGLLGSGRTETLEALFGVLQTCSTSKVYIQGKECSVSNPKQAMEHKIALIPEDRKKSGLVVGHSIRTNMSLPSLVSKRMSLKDEIPRTWFWKNELKLKSDGIDQSAEELSGGNQQKVVFAKWLLTDPDILLLDEPTRGVDIGAKVEIYEWIQKKAQEGLGVILVSSEMPELMGLCHRIIVLREGQFSAEFDSFNTTQEDIMRAASI